LFQSYKTAAEIHQMLQEAFRDNVVSQSKTFLLFKRFEDRQTCVDDDERSGWQSTSRTLENIAKVREAILADQRQTIHDVCEIVGLSYRTVQFPVADNLNMQHSFVRFAPRLLTTTRSPIALLSATNSNNKPETTPTSFPIS